MSCQLPGSQVSELYEFKRNYLEQADNLGLSPNANVLRFIKDVAKGIQSFDRLDLREKGLNDRSLQPLLFALKTNTSVHDLILSSNFITDLSVFSELLEENHTIQGIDLSNNPFSKEAGANLAKDLRNHSNIRWFNLNNEIEDPMKGYQSPQFKTEQSLHFKTEADEGQDSVRSTPGRRPESETNSMFVRSKYLQVGPYSSRAVNKNLATEGNNSGYKQEKDLTEMVLSKSESKVGKKLWFSPSKSKELEQEESASIGKLFMSRVEWMLQLKEIFHRLVLEFDENVFHKRYIIQKIREFQDSFTLMDEEEYAMKHLDRGCSVNQVIEAIKQSQENYLRYDDVTEMITIIGKNQNLLVDMPLVPLSSRNINRTEENYHNNSSQNFAIPSIKLPKNTEHGGECSFSFEHTEPMTFSRRSGNNSTNIKPLNLNFRTSPDKLPSGAGRLSRSNKKEMDHSIQLDESPQSMSSNHTGISTEIGTLIKVTPTATQRKASFQNYEEQNKSSTSLHRKSPHSSANKTAKRASVEPKSASHKGYDDDEEYEEEEVSEDEEEREQYEEGDMNEEDYEEESFGESPLKSISSRSLNSATKNRGVLMTTPSELQNRKTPFPEDIEQTQETRSCNPTDGTCESRAQLTQGNIEILVKTTEEAPLEEMEYDTSVLRRGNIEIQAPTLNKLERLLDEIRSAVENDTAGHEELEVLHQIPSFKVHCADTRPLASFSFDALTSSHGLPICNKTFVNLLCYTEAIRVTNFVDFQTTLPLIWHQKLKILNLSGNNLTSISFISHLDNLEFLNLNCNRLTYLPEMACSSTLKELCLAHNKLPHVATLNRLTELSLLDVSFNQLNSYEDLSNLSLNKKLKVLNLSGNPITTRPFYKGTLSSILSHISGLDVFDPELSDFKQYGDVCFATANVPLKRNNQLSRSASRLFEKSPTTSPQKSPLGSATKSKKGKCGSVSIQSNERVDVDEVSRVYSVSDLLASHNKKPESTVMTTRHQSQATVERKDSFASYYNHQRSGSRGPIPTGHHQKTESYAQIERKGSLASISHGRTESRGFPTGRHPSQAQLERKDSVIIRNTEGKNSDYGKFNGISGRSSSKNLLRSNSSAMIPMKAGGRFTTNTISSSSSKQGQSNIKVIHVDIGKRIPTGEKDSSMRKTSVSAMNDSYAAKLDGNAKTGERSSYSKLHGNRHSAMLSIPTNVKPRQYFNFKFNEPVTATASQQKVRFNIPSSADFNGKKKY